MRGPATVAEALADAIRTTEAILKSPIENKYSQLYATADTARAEAKKGIILRSDEASHESVRCLECATICECCVDVCPNRANISVEVGGNRQIIHIDYMCNECGNCAVFCPYASAPYHEKFTYFVCEKDFRDSENPGFLPHKDGTISVRLDGAVAVHKNGSNLPSGIWELTQAIIAKTYLELK
jgi:putative selenate reductase